MQRLDEFYRGRRVLVTGHTGFKGAWLCHVLKRLGARVYGFALECESEESLYRAARVEEGMCSMIGDVRDQSALLSAFREARPEVVFHLAAQPLVREGYADPVYTYEVNVMGAVHLMDCVKSFACVRSVVHVTTDKVYENVEDGRAFREDDRLDGFDPYANSKSCAELVTGAFVRSYLLGRGVAVSTVRAGNVIGGGDVAKDRILPDCVRALTGGKPLFLRSPDSVRPYQHVLEPILFYLMLGARQYEAPSLAGAYNVGPRKEDHVTTAELVALFETAYGKAIPRQTGGETGPHEAKTLLLDTARAERVLGYLPRTNVQEAVRFCAEFEKCRVTGGDICAVMDKQIDYFLSE